MSEITVTRSVQKRKDLQGIRGLAILSVLAFHFYPRNFPNGYLGVDQFFVLSGFLQCMLLSKNFEKPLLSILANFYARRLKRILPLYILMILLILVALHTVFPTSSIVQNEASATKALLFVSNRQHTDEENYFEKLNMAIDLFTHTWSLSVEVQFYAIVPVIFLIGSAMKGEWRIGFYGCLCAISSIYHFSSSPDFAFNSTLARIWQFLIGMITYFQFVSGSNNDGYSPIVTIEDGGEIRDEAVKNVPTSLENFTKYFFLAPMVCIAFCPIELSPNCLRPIFTVFTGIIMFLSIDDKVLGHKFLTYLGDISYSLYLVHWPIVAYAKMMYEDNEYAHAACLFLSILLAVIIYETFEKWYLTSQNAHCAIVTTILIVFCVLLIYRSKIDDAEIETIENVTVATEVGKQVGNHRSYAKLDGVTDGMTLFDAQKRNMYWSMYDIYIDEMNEPGCVRDFPHPWCYYTEMVTRLKRMLPNIKKKLFIMDSFPRVDENKVNWIVPDLRSGKSMEEISFGLYERDDGYEIGRMRHAALVEECGPKCELIDILTLLRNSTTGQLQYFDNRGLSYFTSRNHLSAHGVELVRPLFSDICDKL
uniref:Acyl_transf_3 domain-containing protein n=1 Tax=Caenorhabditis japonica TaxID=281687 RepID=A0A8R1HYB4_CAEJA